MQTDYEVAVIGLGGIGSHALEHLSRAGVRCIGFDRFAPPHDRGSSHGRSRLIRLAYFEHPNYVPLLRRSFELWEQLSQYASKPLLIRNGLLQVGEAESDLIRGLRSAAQLHQLRLYEVAPQEFAGRLRWPQELVGLLEPIAGILTPEAAIDVALQQSRRHGAHICNHETVFELQESDAQIQLRSDRNSYCVERVIIAAGAWSGDWFSWQVAVPKVLRKHQFWFQVEEPSWHRERDSVSFYFETNEGSFYGIPGDSHEGLKIARHDGGVAIAPDDIDRELGREEELNSIIRFAREYLSGVHLEPVAHEICRYAMSSDGHFRLSTSRRSPHVVGIACLSGHGFKFGPVLGQILAQRVLSGHWDAQAQFLTQETT